MTLAKPKAFYYLAFYKKNFADPNRNNNTWPISNVYPRDSLYVDYVKLLAY